MTSGQKIAFSLLIAMGLFAVFVLSFNTKLFSELETRFYTQSKIAQDTGQLDKISEGCDSYITEILNLIEKGDNAWVKNASVRSYYVQNASESDVNMRRRLTESLFSEIPALNGIRIVDKNGRNVHYSSYDDTDLLKQTGISKIYKNYNDIVKDADEIPFEQLQKITSETKSVLLFDQTRNRLVISVPFCWMDGIYSGVSLFYLNSHEVEKALNAREVIPLGQSAVLFSDDDYSGGYIFNLPYGEKTSFEAPVKAYWKARSSQPEKLLEQPEGGFYVALSSSRSGKIKISAVYNSRDFELSKEIRALIYICIFISILLIVFLIFSFFRDPLVTLQKRIKKIQLGLIENYIDGKEKREWGDLARQLRVRKDDLSSEIIKSLHVHSKKRRKELSDYLDKNWDEIFSIFEARADNKGSGASGNTVVSGSAELTGASIAEIRRMLEEVLQNRNIVAPVVEAAVKAVEASAPVQKKAALEEAEELDEVEELVEDAEELDEVEELSEEAEELDDVEELEEEGEAVEDAEELDEVEELSEEVDDAEELDDVEELEEEGEAVEDAEELDEVEELSEEAEELDEVEELSEDVEDAEELDEVEELSEEVDDAEELDEVEELEEEDEAVEDAEELDEVEELDEEVEELTEEAEDVDEVENLEEEAEDVDELDEVEELEEEADDAEDIDELDEVEELEDADDEIEELEGADEPAPNPVNLMAALARTPLDYVPSNETYFASEKFPNVDNLYAEELRLGGEIQIKKSASLEDMFTQTKLVEFNSIGLPDFEFETAAPENIETPEIVEDDVIEDDIIEDEIIDNVEELTEEVPEVLSSSDLVLTNFAENFAPEMPELEEVASSENVILENDGVYSIAENLEYTNIIQDPDFKQLVDSIL